MKFALKLNSTFTVNKEHPDYQYIKEPGMEQDFSDTYMFDCGYDYEDALQYAIGDMLLVISGGYKVKKEYFKSVKIVCNGNTVYEYTEEN